MSGPGHRLRGAEHVRQERERGAKAVVGRPDRRNRRTLPGSGAHCDARIVEDAGRSPALRAAHDRAVAVRVTPDAEKLGRDQIERALPRYRHEALAPAGFAAAWARSQASPPAPSAAQMRIWRMHRRGHRLRAAATDRIARERPDADHAPVVDFGQECTPMRVIAGSVWVASHQRAPEGTPRYRASSCPAPPAEFRARRTSAPALRAPWAGSAGRATSSASPCRIHASGCPRRARLTGATSLIVSSRFFAMKSITSIQPARKRFTAIRDGA